MLYLCLVPSLLIPMSSLRVEAQQPAQRPAAWSGSIAPPAEILGLTDARPLLPLEFSRAWLEKVELVRLRREQLAARGTLDGMTPARLAAAGAALAGTLRIPVIPIHYDGEPIPFSRTDLVQRLFGPGLADTVSLARYWSEVSGGLLEVEGAVSQWIETRRPARHYLPPEQFGWSIFGRVGELRDEVLRAADGHMDFTQFDNDGPDGVPDSGDDDGFVDFIALVYALPCPGDARAGAIWPHRGTMAPFVTQSIGADGEPIRISDYVILPAVDPQTCGPLQVGVLAHETGHALGLPDLYDYDGTSQGIGAWGLMGTGSHAAHHSPAHLGAWEKEQLGWVAVSWLDPADTTLAIAPVQTDHTVYRFDRDDGAYILLENRRRTGSDSHIPGGGLLIWSVDPERGELGAWNMDERRAAVSLVQADRRNDLAAGRPADAGDPFPGETGRRTFRSGPAGGLRLEAIREEADIVHAELRAAAPTPLMEVDHGVLRITALADGDIVRQSVAVIPDTTIAWHTAEHAGWLEVERTDSTVLVAADPLGLPPGTYTDTVDLAGDDGAALAHLVVSFYIATPGVAQVIASELPWSWGIAIRGGRILQASYGWDHLGMRPRPRVLQQWEGATHPGTLARIAADALYAPAIDPADGASFVLARALDGNYLYRLLPSGDTKVIASRIGSSPAYGAAVLPDGSVAVAEWNGDITHVRRDGSMHAWMSLGTNIYQIATDAAGTIYAAMYTGDVMVVESDGTRRVLETGFAAGRLVAVATTPSGDVLAAERGGDGRIMRIREDGSRDVVYHRKGSHFYGLAVDEQFLFALDLARGHLLRIPLPAATSDAYRIVDAAADQRGYSR